MQGFIGFTSARRQMGLKGREGTESNFCGMGQDNCSLQYFDSWLDDRNGKSLRHLSPRTTGGRTLRATG